MSEILHRGSNPEEEPSAKVYRPNFGQQYVSPEYIQPDELSDVEIVDQFLAQLSHPSARRQSSELGEYLQSVLGGRNSSNMTEEDEAWRSRITGLMIDVDELHDDELTQLLATDEVLRELYDSLRATKEKAKELKEERRALLLLRELRAGITMRNIPTSEFHEQRWHSLVNRLV